MAGSVPSSATEPSWGEPPEPSQWGPTDDELLAAMDAFEKQCEAEAAEAAAAADTAMDTMEGEPEDRPLSETWKTKWQKQTPPPKVVVSPCWWHFYLLLIRHRDRHSICKCRRAEVSRRFPQKTLETDPQSDFFRPTSSSAS